MAIGRMSHHWDLFAPLLCCVVNPHIEKKTDKWNPDKIHPYREIKVKPFNRADWLDFKAKITGER